MKTRIWFLAGGMALAMTAGAAAQAVDPAKVTQPEGVELHQGDEAALVEKGKALYSDTSLGESGLACSNCHQNFGQYRATFKKPYPHAVNMAKGKAGLDEVNAAEMVQLCMVVPMQTEPLDWKSEELAALTAYVKDERKRFAAQSE